MTLCAGFNKVPVRNNHVLSQILPLYLIIGSFRLRSTSLRGETNAVDRVREGLIVWRSLSKGYQTCRKTEKQQINNRSTGSIYLCVYHLPIYLSIYRLIRLSIFLSHSLPQSIYRPVCQPIYQCNLSLSLSLSLYVFLSVCLSIRLSIPLCFYLSVCLTICCLYTYPYTHIPLSLCLFLLGT